MSPDIQDLGFFLRSFCFFLNATFTGICFIFTGFHVFYLLFYGKTTLEYCEKKNAKDEEANDQGFYNNFKEIFGCNPILWCFPINTTKKYKNEALYDPKHTIEPFSSPEKQNFRIFSTDHSYMQDNKEDHKVDYIEDSKAELMVQIQKKKSSNDCIE